MARPMVGPATASRAMAGAISREVADITRSRKPAAARLSPLAVRRDRSGTITRHKAPMNPVGRPSRGRVMPHSTPNSDMASLSSIPPSTSLAGMRTELAQPSTVPSREVAPTGRAMANSRRRPTWSRAGSGGNCRQCRWNSRVRAQAENTSQRTMPSTMIPTVSSADRGRRAASSPSTAAARMSCSAVSTAAGGRTRPMP